MSSSDDDAVRADAGESEQEKRAREMEETLRKADAKKKADAEESEKKRAADEKKMKADAEEAEKAADAGQKLDKILRALDSVAKTCDSFKARLDALDGGDGEEHRELAAPAADDAAKRRADAAAKTHMQARADEVYNAHGQTAPRHLYGERATDYRVRLLNGLKAHSSVLKNVDLHKIALDPAALDVAEVAIFADATAEGLTPKRSQILRNPDA